MNRTIFIEDMVVGLERSRSKLITLADISAFGDVSGDRNPVHFDEEYAAKTRFGGVIAHGMLSASLISAVLGEDLPGHGAVYLSQTLEFRAPVRPGDTVVAKVSVTSIDVEKRRLVLDCACWVDETIVLEGRATVLAPSRRKKSRAAPSQNVAHQPAAALVEPMTGVVA